MDRLIFMMLRGIGGGGGRLTGKGVAEVPTIYFHYCYGFDIPIVLKDL